MGDTKSNAEIAREILDSFNVPEYEDARLHKRVESALTTAQSSLAKQVLETVTKYKGTFALVRGVEGDIIDVTCNQIDKRLHDLFTRLNIKVGE